MVRSKPLKPLVFKVSKTYADVTPESAEHGDFDATGFVWEGEELTFRELVEEFSGHNCWQLAEGADWLSTGFYTVCYMEGREREENLHIERPTARHERYYRLALKLAGVK